MTHMDFVRAFINAKKAENKRKGLPFKGIHTVLSGFNEEFRTLFGNTGMSKEQRQALPITAITVLQDAGQVRIIPAKRGAMLYLAEDFTEKAEKPKQTAEEIARKYGLTPPPVIAPKSEPAEQQATA